MYFICYLIYNNFKIYIHISNITLIVYYCNGHISNIVNKKGYNKYKIVKLYMYTTNINFCVYINKYVYILYVNI